MWLSCGCHTMFTFLQPTEEDKVLKVKVLDSCKQVGALKCLMKYLKCFTEIFSVLFHPPIIPSPISPNLPFYGVLPMQNVNSQACAWVTKSLFPLPLPSPTSNLPLSQWKHCTSHSECDSFLVSIYYVYDCVLLTMGSSGVRTSAIAKQDTCIPQVGT